jgi:O-antigen ligase
MTLRGSWRSLGPVGLAVALAALWPLSAYAASPLVLPVVLVAAAIAAIVITQPQYGVALAAALAPIADIHIGGHHPLTDLLLAMVAGLVVYGILLGRLRGAILPGVGVAAVVLLVVFTAADLQALEPHLALPQLRWFAAAIGVLLATLMFCRTRRSLVIVAVGAVLGLALAGGQGVIQELSGHYSAIEIVVHGQAVKRIEGSFGHPNQFAGYLAVYIPLAVAMALSRAFSPPIRGLSLLAAGLGLAALDYTYTRAALAALVAGAVIWLAVVRPRLAVAAVIVLAAGTAVLLPSTLNQRLKSTSGEEVGLRTDIWGSALDIAAQHPLLGVGGGNFPVAYAALPSTPAFASQRHLLHDAEEVVPPHAQSLYLNILAEDGLIGIVALAAFGIAAAGTAYRASHVRDPQGRAIGLGLGAGLMVLAVHSVVEVTSFDGERLELPLLALLAVATIFIRTDREQPGTAAES